MTHFLVIGSGRWAQHLQKSLALAGNSYSNWARRTQTSAQLESELKRSTHVWLAISDQALEEWRDRLQDFAGVKIHSSGALEIEGLHSVHPLMSFSSELYPDSFYSRFAFVTTSKLSRKDLIPGLPNSLTSIPVSEKAHYHALCVLAGNGGVLLWQKFLSDMAKLGIAESALKLYAERIFENILRDPISALTGPLVRGDHQTLQKDLEALNNDPYQKVLQSLIEAYGLTGKAAL